MTRMTQSNCPRGPGFLGRRGFLIMGGAAVTVLSANLPFLSGAAGQDTSLVMSRYPERLLGKLSALKLRDPVEFAYPTEDVLNLLIRLGERAGGGIGPDEDVIAFNTVCTHMGGPVGPEVYHPEHAILGPCPLHLTTFDLTKHGMVISGHATESLPQIVLDLRGDEIYATGVMGLMYGYNANPTGT